MGGATWSWKGVIPTHSLVALLVLLCLWMACGGMMVRLSNNTRPVVLVAGCFQHRIWLEAHYSTTLAVEEIANQQGYEGENRGGRPTGGKCN